MGEPSCGGEEGAVSMAISGEPGPEVGEPPGGGEEDVASIAISGEPGPEVDERPGGGEEDAVSVAISGESGPEVSEPFPALPPPFSSSFARSGSPFSPPARVGDSSRLRVVRKPPKCPQSLRSRTTKPHRRL
jgi:hypothetical protein